MGCHVPLQGVFPTQGSNLGLLHCRQVLYHLNHQGRPSKGQKLHSVVALLVTLEVLHSHKSVNTLLKDSPKVLSNIHTKLELGGKCSFTNPSPTIPSSQIVSESLTKPAHFGQAWGQPLAWVVLHRRSLQRMRCCHRNLSGRVQEGPKGGGRSLANLPETLTLESILAERHVHQQERLQVTKDGPGKMTGQRQPRNSPHHHKTWDCKPRDRGVLLLLSTQTRLPNKVSFFISMCVSLDNSFPSVRWESTLRPWKGSTFLQQDHFCICPKVIAPLWQDTQPRY